MMRPHAAYLDVYFLLSHVRSSIPNRWVQRFHQALDLAVQLRAEPTAGLRVASVYLETEAVAHRAHELGDLPEARVVVPLYTREFLHEPPPEYLRLINGWRPDGRRALVHPVLWDPHPGGRNVLGLASARSLGAGIPDYEEYGLAAMCRLNAFARDYKIIVDRLAERIVTAAEWPDRIPAWAGDEVATTDQVGEVRFVVWVIAVQGRQWSPFRLGRDAAIAERTAAAARRFLLLPEVVDHADAAAAAQVRDSPGVLLVDPWALDRGELRELLRTTLQDLPPWMTLLLVVDGDDPDRSTRQGSLADRAVELSGHRARLVSNGAEFERVIDDIVNRTRRSYLSRQPVNPPRDV